MATWRYPGQPDQGPEPPAVRTIPLKVDGLVVGYGIVTGNDDYGVTVIMRITKPLPVRYMISPRSTFSFQLP